MVERRPAHDAMIFWLRRVPTTMIFLRSPEGISHHPEGVGSSPGCTETALGRPGRAFLRLMTKVVSKEQSCITSDTHAAIANPPPVAGRRIPSSACLFPASIL